MHAQLTVLLHAKTARSTGFLNLKIQTGLTTGITISFQVSIPSLWGEKTYEALLGLVDEWPYPNCKTYVVTHKTSFEITTASTSVLHEVNEEVINDLMNRSSKNIWLVGGGELITCFVNLGAIDEMIISIIPIILGKGIRLFTGIPVETNYELVNTESFETGVVNLKYKKKQK